MGSSLLLDGRSQFEGFRHKFSASTFHYAWTCHRRKIEPDPGRRERIPKLLPLFLDPLSPSPDWRRKLESSLSRAMRENSRNGKFQAA